VAGDGGGRSIPRDSGLDTDDTADQSESAAMLPRQRDADRQAARERLSCQRYYRDHARAVEAAMPLVEFYQRRAVLRPTPAGPDVCPPACPGCRRRPA
jgi:hypothetical protein